MATVNDVLAQMAASLPTLPPTPLDLNGKFKKFGKGKKSWYKLSEIKLDDGRFVVAGAFGRFQGRDPGTIRVEIGRASLSDADLAAIKRGQEEKQRQEEQRRQNVAKLAAGRARRQWSQGKDASDVADHPYLMRKQIVGEYARVHEDGTLMVPARRYTRTGAEMACVQKIAPDGEKRFNAGADTVGASCLLGTIAVAVRQIGVAEGYASGQSVRLACAGALPVMVTFSAGNIRPVARQLRADFPDAELIFFADDDWQLVQRYMRDVLEEFDVEAPVIDGADHVLKNPAGDTVTVRATWRKDATGTDYIEADVRAGRRFHVWKFENAGIASARAAAREVGNARVVWPAFANRGENKWTDFNDLHVQESLAAASAQVMAALGLYSDSEVPPAPSHVECVPEAAPPAPSSVVADSEITGQVTLEWALSHCALIQGSTDVWDSLNKLRMKRAAFIEMVGKDVAKAWSSSGERRAISPRNLPRVVRGVASEDGGAGADNIVMMLDRYTLLYGTKTVWDAEKRTILAYDAMALARGADLAKRWIEHPMHREIDLDKLVFDPTQKVDLDTHINMFEGFPLKPKKDEAKAKLALGLLYSLCSGEPNCDEVFSWVLSWLAYPLQNPGAKMQTALLFFGEKQGTGKSLFFEGIVKPIYGAHGATGGQHQLEAQYTHWRSQKLYVLFEEILSRQDKYSHFGLIKHMITGRDMPISQKFKDDRTEANHMNVVMLSNEFQAVPIEPDDRRFLVAEARNRLDPQLLEQIKAALKDGLCEAFYAFLLEYPIVDFDPYTFPIMTHSKERMINFGRQDWEAFYLAWAAGDLSVPYCSCLSTDLYIIYSRFCSKYGFRAMTLTKFSELIAQRVLKDRQWVQVGPSAAKKLLTVFHVPVPEGREPESLSKQCEKFRTLAEIKETV